MQVFHVLAGPGAWTAAAAALVVTTLLASLYVAMAASTAGPLSLSVEPTVTEMGFVACSILVLAGLVSGCLVAGQEWGSGQLCYVLAAVPNRLALLAARWAVVAAFWTLVGVVSGFIVVVLARLAAPQAPTPTTSETVQLVAGAGLGAGLAAGLAVSLATLLRSTLWSVLVSVLISAVLPVLLSSVTQVRWLLPSGALTALASLPSDLAGVVQPPVGLVVGVAWSVVVGTPGWWRLSRCDV